MSYRITTDSTCDLPQSYYAERDIACIGLTFRINGKEYIEGPNTGITAKEFYDALRAGEQSTTMQINTYQFMEFVEPFLQAGEDVLHVAFSSGLSGTYDSYMRGVEELKEKYPERTVRVVDSLCASLGEGLLTHYAYENWKNGLSLEDNAQWLEENKLHLCHWFTVDDLMHLHRGGRVSKTSAVMGSLLGIKPILHVDDEGHLILMSKVRGRAKSMEALADKMKETALDNVKEQAVFISHGDCEDEARKLAEIVTQKTGVKVMLINTIGAVIGTHSGPGTLALFFMGHHR